MEADIKINGSTLTSAQSMTVRVALTDLRATMTNSEALGDDAHSRSMTEAYHARSSEVLELIHELSPKKEV